MKVGFVTGALAASVWFSPAVTPDLAPAAVTVATARGESAVPVMTSHGHPALAMPRLTAALPIEGRVVGDWANIEFGGQSFNFLLDAPLFRFQGRIYPLAGGAYVARDTLYVPLQWLAEHVPRVFREAYRYDPLAARFEEIGLVPVATRISPRPSPPSPPVSDAARRSGLRRNHKVVVDAGHGGRDGGTRGGGLSEKAISLSVARYLETALRERGVAVVMTRTRDVFVPLDGRASLCRADCDLFVSIHVNALEPTAGYQRVSGFETYFFDHRRQEAPDRLEELENSSLRYEMGGGPSTGHDPATAILRDLEENEYLRESAQLADLIRETGGEVHPNGARKVGQRNFQVLRLATRPAVLVETGYSTNPRDARFLRSPSGQQQLAVAIADGIVRYLQRYETMVSR